MEGFIPKEKQELIYLKKDSVGRLERNKLIDKLHELSTLIDDPFRAETEGISYILDYLEDQEITMLWEKIITLNER